jgi:hypothetical protein
MGRGFVLNQGDGFLKICSRSSFRWQVKLEAPLYKIFQHVKDPLMHLRANTQIFYSFVHSSYLLSDVSAGRTARELWWMSQEFSPGGIITMALHHHVSPAVTLAARVQILGCNESKSTSSKTVLCYQFTAVGLTITQYFTHKVDQVSVLLE